METHPVAMKAQRAMIENCIVIIKIESFEA